MCTTHDQYICGFYPAMNIIKMHTTLVVCKHTISLEVCCHTYSVLTYTAQLPYCYYYKRVLILANIGDLVITAKFCARY